MPTQPKREESLPPEEPQNVKEVPEESENEQLEMLLRTSTVSEPFRVLGLSGTMGATEMRSRKLKKEKETTPTGIVPERYLIGQERALSPVPIEDSDIFNLPHVVLPDLDIRHPVTTTVQRRQIMEVRTPLSLPNTSTRVMPRTPVPPSEQVEKPDLALGFTRKIEPSTPGYIDRARICMTSKSSGSSKACYTMEQLKQFIRDRGGEPRGKKMDLIKQLNAILDTDET